MCQVGADYILTATPYYNKPSQGGLHRHFTAIADASSKPICLYNVPGRTAVNLQPAVTLQRATHPNVIGIKEASGDMSRVYEMRLRYGDRFQIICGSDDQALDYFLWGCVSWIGGAASCAPRQHVDVIEAALAGDFAAARARMEKLMPMLRNMESGGYTQKVKMGCELLGIPVGNPRRPLLPLTAEDRTEFERIFKTI